MLHTKKTILALYILTLSSILGVFLALEVTARLSSTSDSSLGKVDARSLMQILPTLPVKGRELEGQMLVHNAALFSQHPTPTKVTSGYVGTSRSKVLRPNHFGINSMVVGAGNTYGEISYGLLLQAEIIRLRFPNLKRVFFEASLLLRRPGRLILEEDHEKYLPLLMSIHPLCEELSSPPACQNIFDQVDNIRNGEKSLQHSELLPKRSTFKLSSLILEDQSDEIVLPLDVPFMTKLQFDGERKDLSGTVFSDESKVVKISNDHIKVQRLREITSYGAGDRLFDLIALWGRAHNIEVVLFQPPVRADLYHYQLEYGLKSHIEDIERISKAYNIPFIDLNRPGLGFMEAWSLFSDEDHLETCMGSGLLTLALEDGYKSYKTDNILFPEIYRKNLNDKYAQELSVCR